MVGRDIGQGWVVEVFLESAVQAVNGLLESFAVAKVDDAVIREALSLGWQDFEDAVQMASVGAESVDYLITRNIKDFQSGSVPVIQPAAFLTLLDSARGEVDT